MNFKQYFNELHQADAKVGFVKVASANLLNDLKRAADVYLGLHDTLIAEAQNFDLATVAEEIVIPSDSFRKFMKSNYNAEVIKNPQSRWADASKPYDGNEEVPKMEPWKYKGGTESFSYFYTNDIVLKLLAETQFMEKEFFIASKLKGRLELIPIIDTIVVNVDNPEAKEKKLLFTVAKRVKTENLAQYVQTAISKITKHMHGLAKDVLTQDISLEALQEQLTLEHISTLASLSKTEQKVVSDLTTITKEVLKETGYFVGADFLGAPQGGGMNVGEFTPATKRAKKGVKFTTWDLGRGLEFGTTYDPKTKKPVLDLSGAGVKTVNV